MLRYHLLIFFLCFAIYGVAQHRPTDHLSKEDRIGLTGMFRYTVNNWSTSEKSKYGNLNFDSFRIWGQTDIDNLFFASAQYRLYQDWHTIQHLYVGFHYKDLLIKVGQTWVPFGYDWQTFDDWGNLMYYTGLQDDYDYGATVSIPYKSFHFDIGLFKNAQLSSSSPMRYDPDFYSGDINSADDLIRIQKANEEVNQFNLNGMYNIEEGSIEGKIGASFMAGQIYNSDEDDFGSRMAYALYAGIDYNWFHANAQFTAYNYKQKLSSGYLPNDYDFVNMSCFNVSYEIPSKTNIIAFSLATDILEDHLTYHVNYSLLWGGTSEADSYIVSTGLRSLLGPLDIFMECYYGVNDPQLSGDSSGYGRNASSNDFRFDLRMYYSLNVHKKMVVPKNE